MSEIEKIREDWQPLLNNSDLADKFKHEMRFVLDYISTLEEKVNELEKAIKKHRENLREKLGVDNPPFYEEDEELYKTLKEGKNAYNTNND